MPPLPREIKVRGVLGSVALVALLLGSSAAFAAIDTSFIEGPWPKERVRTTEVGRHQVRWRSLIAKKAGSIFAGLRFTAPLDQQTIWGMTADYNDIGKKMPGVKAVRFLEQSETREVIAIDVKILWKELTLTFEIEREPPRVTRFRLVNEALGEYRGVALYTPEGTGTAVELSTWLQPAQPVPARLLLGVERIALLQGAREFLEDCDKRLKTNPPR